MEPTTFLCIQGPVSQTARGAELRICIVRNWDEIRMWDLKLSQNMSRWMTREMSVASHLILLAGETQIIIWTDGAAYPRLFGMARELLLIAVSCAPLKAYADFFRAKKEFVVLACCTGLAGSWKLEGGCVK